MDFIYLNGEASEVYILTLPKNYIGSNLATCRTHFMLPNPCHPLKLSTGSGSSLTTKPWEWLIF